MGGCARVGRCGGMLGGGDSSWSRIFCRFSRHAGIFWRSGAWQVLDLSLKLQISPPKIFWLPKESFKKAYKKKRYILVLVKYIYLPFCFLKCNISFNTFSGLWSLVSGLWSLWSLVGREENKRIENLKKLKKPRVATCIKPIHIYKIINLPKTRFREA